ncbi:queuosine precursor transporter [Marivibrio halodurans]|uniref:Probable queuosine precursor transporter n=1 Tax=Marivibrio halodurans TaxID=2039722 RepID=A0A8J7S389_9PROT|nr:queuosine precursor transporter [Marivibrio halodurans]MBP5857909.1 queuosine precursor transporter [Marivibrio halodurans]
MTDTRVRAGLLLPPMLAMGLVILAANILVQYPIQATVGGLNLADWLTYGAVSYPIAFLVTDTTNRLFGAGAARRVVYVGFAVGVILSLIFAPTRIAIASGSAFLLAQLLDVTVFDQLRAKSWWKAPFVSSFLGSAVDTALFFSIAFAGTSVPWVSLGFGDFLSKLAMALLLLPAFRAIVAFYPRTLRAAEAA